eukprot:992962-Alexandrium_andersonii.AAC.1
MLLGILQLMRLEPRELHPLVLLANSQLTMLLANLQLMRLEPRELYQLVPVDLQLILLANLQLV